MELPIFASLGEGKALLPELQELRAREAGQDEAFRDGVPPSSCPSGPLTRSFRIGRQTVTLSLRRAQKSDRTQYLLCMQPELI